MLAQAHGRMVVDACTETKPVHTSARAHMLTDAPYGAYTRACMPFGLGGGGGIRPHDGAAVDRESVVWERVYGDV